MLGQSLPPPECESARRYRGCACVDRRQPLRRGRRVCRVAVPEPHAADAVGDELLAAAVRVRDLTGKKMVGFYTDLEREHFSVYVINANTLINEDVA
jgi:hypothetical protein